MNNNFTYTKTNDGKFLWMAGEEMPPFKPFDSLSFLIDKGDANNLGRVILRHGESEFIKKRFNEMVETLNNAGHNDFASDLCLVDVSNFPIEEINKCLEISNYIDKIEL